MSLNWSYVRMPSFGLVAKVEGLPIIYIANSRLFIGIAAATGTVGAGKSVKAGLDAAEANKLVASCASIAVSMKSVLDTPLLTDDGLLTPESQKVLESAQAAPAAG